MTPFAMEPVFPDRDRLEELALEILKAAAALGSMLPAITQQGITDMLRLTNSYYSNKIEGHSTHPADIERAMRDEYVEDPTVRLLQRESRAHIEVEMLMEKRLREEPQLNVCSLDFLLWLHRQFYERVPAEFRYVKDAKDGPDVAVQPGKLRDHNVRVGMHDPPGHEHLEMLLARFSEAYNPERLSGIQRVLALAASHHRLMWIHPFTDGNGRVARLFSAAYAIQADIKGSGLWTISRGLARRRQDYMGQLSLADGLRRHDADGRGALSFEGLTSFCKFFLESCLDQIAFMRQILALDGLGQHLLGYSQVRAAGALPGKADAPFPKTVGRLLEDVMLRGEVARGEVGRILGVSPAWARKVIAGLLQEGLLTSDSPKGVLRLGFPSHAAGYYFPQLYPEGVT